MNVMNSTDNKYDSGIVVPNRIFVGALPAHLTEHELKQLFSQFGNVVNVKIIHDRHGSPAKEYGFVTFDDAEVASHVIREQAKSLFIRGRRINVAQAVRKAIGNPRFGHRNSNHANYSSHYESSTVEFTEYNVSSDFIQSTPPPPPTVFTPKPNDNLIPIIHTPILNPMNNHNDLNTVGKSLYPVPATPQTFDPNCMAVMAIPCEVNSSMDEVNNQSSCMFSTPLAPTSNMPIPVFGIVPNGTNPFMLSNPDSGNSSFQSIPVTNENCNNQQSMYVNQVPINNTQYCDNSYSSYQYSPNDSGIGWNSSADNSMISQYCPQPTNVPMETYAIPNPPMLVYNFFTQQWEPMLNTYDGMSYDPSHPVSIINPEYQMPSALPSNDVNKNTVSRPTIDRKYYSGRGTANASNSVANYRKIVGFEASHKPSLKDLSKSKSLLSLPNSNFYRRGGHMHRRGFRFNSVTTYRSSSSTGNLKHKAPRFQKQPPTSPNVEDELSDLTSKITLNDSQPISPTTAALDDMELKMGEDADEFPDLISYTASNEV